MLSWDMYQIFEICKGNVYAELMRTTVNNKEFYTKWEAWEHPAAPVIC